MLAVKIHYRVPTGIVHVGYNPMPSKGKVPHCLIPTKFLRRSYDSKDALFLFRAFDTSMPQRRILQAPVVESSCRRTTGMTLARGWPPRSAY
jgi:hypothetical protein